MTREEAQADLPYYVNGTLSEEDRAAVAEWLESDADLRAEADALAALRARMQEEEVVSPGLAGRDRLLATLDRVEPANLSRQPRWLQIAAALLAAVILVQGFFLVGQSDDPGGFQLAGGDAAAVTVAFRADGTEAEIRAALLDAGFVIVDGPSALGLYGLAPLDGVDLEAAVESLTASGVAEDIQEVQP